MGLDNIEIWEDCSAINYYVESYVFTRWYESELNSAMPDKLKISNTNLPEDENSDFSSYKKEIMKNIIITELNKSISSYSSHSSYQYNLPKLSETEWEQIFSNVSIISFFQGVPTGTKYYNGYAIAVSTKNKEYVDPKQIYMISPLTITDYYYHKPGCDEMQASSIYIGYRSVEFNRKTLGTYQYYMHPDKDYAEFAEEIQSSSAGGVHACYNCLVDSNDYNADYSSQNYLTALGRERYVQK